MRTLVLLNAKGGVGKTTLAVHYLAYLIAARRKVGLIDCDPMETASRWALTRFPGLLCWRPRSMPDFERAYRAATTGTDLLVVDGVARLDELSVLAAGYADLICVPVTASPLDLQALQDMTPLLDALRRKRENLKVRVVLNGLRVQTRTAKALLGDRPMGTCGVAYVGPWRRFWHVLRVREAYRQAYAKGGVVQDLGYRARDAKRELAALCREMLSELRMSQKVKS